MAVSRRPSGVRVDYPSTYRIGQPSPPAARTRRVRRPAGQPLLSTSASEMSSERDALVSALTTQAMDHVDTIALQPTRAATSSTGRRTRGLAAIPARQSVRLAVDLEPSENAVLLLEQDGTYAWVLPDRTSTSAVRSSRRGRGSGTKPTTRTAEFTIDVRARATARAVRPTRGFASGLIYRTVHAIVLKFVAPRLLGNTVALLERHITEGLVAMTVPDPGTWAPLNPTSHIALPKGRTPRILLFVHGTFSSTVGGFAALGTHPWGSAFLTSAFASYDAVLGYDHRTLSDDPTDNAVDLLETLRAAVGDAVPVIDIICHSRGGLVTRALTELVLPGAGWHPTIGKVVFVAAPNAGTLLAEPANWHALIDLYTNISMAATRALGLVPQAAAFAHIVNGIVQGVGALVKAITDAAVTENGVRGLAAMEPSGPYIKALNRAQPGQPAPQTSMYYVSSSDFEVNGDGEPSSELPPRFVQFLIDGFVDRLMKEPSDLVVNVSSMGAIDPTAGNFVDDRLDFPANRTVYHCNYFAQPSLVANLAAWLSLPMSPAALPPSPAPSPSPPRRRVRLGGYIDAALPARFNTDLLVTSSSSQVRDVMRALEVREPGYVVIHRALGDFNYAMRPEEVRTGLRGAKPDAPLDQVLSLHEDTSSMTSSQADLPAMPTDKEVPSRGRVVIERQNEIVGVLPEAVPPQSADELARVARGVRRSPAKRIGTSRRPPADAQVPAPIQVGPRPTSRPRREKRSSPLTHMAALMPDTVEMGQTVSIQVDIAHEDIQTGPRPGSDVGVITPDAERALIIQVIPKANLTVIGSDRVEIPVPNPNAPAQLFFDVQAAVVGQAEVWVVVRQDHFPMLTLKLHPTVVPESDVPVSSKPQHAEGAVGDAPPNPEIATLRITEVRQGDQVAYEFDLDIKQFNVLVRKTSDPIKGNRDDYVRRLYSQLESDWGESKSQVREFQSRLREFGARLLDELVPKEIQAPLWKHRKALKSIMVLSEEPFIPWELVHLKAPGSRTLAKSETAFLAQLGLIRWLWEGTPPNTLRVRAGRAFSLIPDYPADTDFDYPPDTDYALPSTAAEGVYLAKAFGAKALSAQPDKVRSALAQQGSFDLLHFAGHGCATGGNVSDARILLQGVIQADAQGNRVYREEGLSADTVALTAKLEGKDGSRPIVVLNACQAGRMGTQLTTTGGFAKSFIEARAGVFVSGLWTILDEPASEFTEAFYDALLAGKTLAEAAIAGRERSRRAGDATWLAYVVYGNPAAKLSMT